MCWTTTYAWCGADAFTQELVGADVLADGEPPHALTPPIIRASVALAHMKCLRTVLPPGGRPFPNAPLKADRQELPCRCARTGSPFRALRSPGSRIAAPVRLPEVVLPQWLVSDGGSSLTVARQLRFCTGFPWCPARNVSSRHVEAWAGARGSHPPHSRNATQSLSVVQGDIGVSAVRARP